MVEHACGHHSGCHIASHICLSRISHASINIPVGSVWTCVEKLSDRLWRCRRKVIRHGCTHKAFLKVWHGEFTRRGYVVRHYGCSGIGWCRLRWLGSRVVWYRLYLLSSRCGPCGGLGTSLSNDERPNCAGHDNDE